MQNFLSIVAAASALTMPQSGIATTADVNAGGRHGTLTDTGRFTRGATIERIYDDVTGTYGSSPAVCTVTAITFADGRRWTAPSPAVIGATQR